MNPVLEEVLRHYDKTATQRDELLEALKELTGYASLQEPVWAASLIGKARAIIAKAEGRVQ